MADVRVSDTPGFSFENTIRNAHLASAGFPLPNLRKTGTTICGVVFNGGVVLGADTRATEGSVVADKNCEKIHYLAENMRCCGAGTSADCDSMTSLMSSQLKLHSYANNGAKPRVSTAVTMFKRRLFQYQGHIGCALVIGGCDVEGAHLYSVHPHGSVDKLPFVSMGSGSLAAMAVLESGYKDNLTREEAMAIVHRAISAGIFNDLGSGSNVDLCIITLDGKAEYLRNYDRPNERIYRSQRGYDYPRGTTKILSESTKTIVYVADETVEVVPMETS
nr:20S proteasome subunit beta type-7B [Andalucia godoyi]|eukprot:ANDGO_00318.mRNA.1 Proteasome subunit beta type-7-B